ncbi:MAG TPA: biopolymer transporter ExbD [Blastocatellia bacterium]|jgi:biopolymer transport protein ExbD
MAYGEVEEGFGSKKLGLAPPNINVTPLIDVLLVLLIIFMVIQPQKEAKFESQIPQKPDPNQAQQVVQNDTRLLLEVSPEGGGYDQTVMLNRRPLSLPELQDFLKSVLSTREDKAIFIKAPVNKAYGDIIAVIDEVKAAGAEPIGLQTDGLPNQNQ